MKKVLSLILSAVMLIGLVPCFSGIVASAATITSYKLNDHVEFGWYPQSRVTDDAVIAALNADGGAWQSYGYYSGTGDWSDGNMQPGDWMTYKDVILGADKYRGVRFSQYRPYYTGFISSTGYSNQDENGYGTNTNYWFRYEPIIWRVLDPSNGLMLSETILDSQAYNNTVYYIGSGYYNGYYQDRSCSTYANNYYESSIRKWLNDDFYNTVFSAAQQALISVTHLDNSAYSTSYSQYDSSDSDDKIFLLSYADSVNPAYGFSKDYSAYDAARRAKGSDYAKAQGLYVSSSYDGTSNWRLRSAGGTSYYARYVGIDGQSNYYYDVSHTINGIRPALKLNPKSEILQSQVIHMGNVENPPISFEAGSEYYAYAGETVIYPKDKVTGWSPQCIFTPPSSDYPYTGDDITWTCSDPSKLEIKSKSSSISGDRAWYICNCNIRAIANGTVTLTASLPDGTSESITIEIITPAEFKAVYDENHYYSEGGFYSEKSFISDSIEVYLSFENKATKTLYSGTGEVFAPIKPVTISATISGDDLSFERDKYVNQYTFTTNQIDAGKIVDDILLLFPHNFGMEKTAKNYTLEVTVSSESFDSFTEKYAFTINATQTTVEEHLGFLNGTSPNLPSVVYKTSKLNFDGNRMLELKDDPEFVWSKISSFDFDNYYPIIFSDIVCSLLNVNLTKHFSLIPSVVKDWIDTYKTILSGIDDIVKEDYHGDFDLSSIKIDKLFKKSKYQSNPDKVDDEFRDKFVQWFGAEHSDAINKTLGVVDKAKDVLKILKFGKNVYNDVVDCVNKVSVMEAFSDAEQELKTVLKHFADSLPAGEYKMREAAYDYLNYSESSTGRIAEVTEAIAETFIGLTLKTFKLVMGKGLSKYVLTGLVNWALASVTINGTALTATAIAGAQTAAGAALTGVALGICLSEFLCDSSNKATEMSKAIYMSRCAPYVIDTLNYYEEQLKTNQTNQAVKYYEYAFAFHKATQSYILDHEIKACEAKANSIIIKLFNRDDWAGLIADKIALKGQIDSMQCHLDQQEQHNIVTRTKVIMIRCPVDVYLYEGSTDVVRIISDATEYVADGIQVIVLGSEKYVLVPADREYSVRIISRDKDSMDYSIAEYENGERIVRFGASNIPLEKEQVFNGMIVADDEPEEYDLITNNNRVSLNEEIERSHAHNYVMTIDKQPTCMTDGRATYICTVCGDRYEELIEKTNHVIERLPGKAATCTETGLTDGEKCSVCGTIITAQKEIPATDHKTVKVSGKAATCTEKGLTDGEKCSVCGTVITAQKEIPAAGHKVVKVAGKAATCTETGLTDGEKCSVCGTVITAQREIPATGHKAVKVAGIAATCTEKGLTDGEKCSVCETVIIAQKEIPATGHSSAKVAGKAATCTEKGLTDGEKCSVCVEVLKAQEEIPALGHKAEAVPGKAATCTEAGLSDGEKCSVCGEVLKAQEEIPALGHTAPDADGKCSRCGEKIAEPPIGTGLRGDANLDGKVLANDARLVLRASAKLETLEGQAFVNCDLNGDGKLLAGEARKILRFSAKLETEL